VDSGFGTLLTGAIDKMFDRGECGRQSSSLSLCKSLAAEY